MSFAAPFWLLGLLAIPVLAWLRGKWGKESAFLYSSLGLVKGITQLSRSRAGRVLMALRWLALAFFFVAMARPRVGHGIAPVKASGIDIVIALDLSPSMAAEDFELEGRRVNRVVIAKDVIKKFVERRVSDRLGLVAFAKQAYVAAPLTLDHEFYLTNLERLDVAQIGDGTAIGSALTAALNRLRNVKSKSRVVILMTDGQDNSSQVPPLTAAEAAEALGVKVYTIGVGTKGTAPVPFRDAFGRVRYVQQPVDIDEETLRKISERTRGKYYRADSTRTLASIYAEIDAFEKTEAEVRKYQYFEELGPWFAIPGAVFFVLELLLGNTVWRKLP